MNREYYKRYYYLERNHWWFKLRSKIIVEKITKYKPRRANLKILNVGVATGKTTELLTEFGEVTSVEYDKECCVFLESQTGIKPINASIEQLPFADESFDIVCSFDVLEHVENHQQGVNELVRVCRNDGIIALSVPAYQMLWSHHDVVNHHQRRYTRKQLQRLFPSGKQVVYKTYFNSLLFLPILLYRTGSNLFRKVEKEDSTSDFDRIQNQFLNNMFYRIFNLEYHLLKRISFPVGCSVFLVWGKRKI